VVGDLNAKFKPQFWKCHLRFYVQQLLLLSNLGRFQVMNVLSVSVLRKRDSNHTISDSCLASLRLLKITPGLRLAIKYGIFFTGQFQAGEHSEINTSKRIFIRSSIFILKRDDQKEGGSNPAIYSI
jgi:hypothetical protein